VESRFLTLKTDLRGENLRLRQDLAESSQGCGEGAQEEMVAIRMSFRQLVEESARLQKLLAPSEGGEAAAANVFLI
jgi:hypothetical protein